MPSSLSSLSNSSTKNVLMISSPVSSSISSTVFLIRRASNAFFESGFSFLCFFDADCGREFGSLGATSDAFSSFSSLLGVDGVLRLEDGGVFLGVDLGVFFLGVDLGVFLGVDFGVGSGSGSCQG